jgi:hypothetical protein
VSDAFHVLVEPPDAFIVVVGLMFTLMLRNSLQPRQRCGQDDYRSVKRQLKPGKRGTIVYAVVDAVQRTLVKRGLVFFAT